MGGKGKKAPKNVQQTIISDDNVIKKPTSNKDEEMNKIMNGINTMNLDDEDFIDIHSFDQSKAILQNAIDDLNRYLRFFEKNQYSKFPKAAQ